MIRVEAICVLNQKKVFEDKSYARVCVYVTLCISVCYPMVYSFSTFFS